MWAVGSALRANLLAPAAHVSSQREFMALVNGAVRWSGAAESVAALPSAIAVAAARRRSPAPPFAYM